jgi:glycogen debranching enzyme
VRRNRRDGFDLRRIRARGGFATAEVLTNVAYAMALDALGRLGAGTRYATLAARARWALLERCWDERLGRFVDHPTGGGGRVSTWSSLAPLALPQLPSLHARRLVEEHLLDPRRYWRRYPVPSTSLQEAAYRPRTRYPLRYWRGPTWAASSWLIQRGLTLHGYEAEAQELAARLQRMVTASGFREYYHPDTGTGQGARAFGMSTLAAVA